MMLKYLWIRLREYGPDIVIAVSLILVLVALLSLIAAGLFP